MKKIVFLLFTLVTTVVYGQYNDTIFRVAGPAIPCRIVTETKDLIQFIANDNGRERVYYLYSSDIKEVHRSGNTGKLPDIEISDVEPETKKENIEIDTLQYLMSENAILKKKITALDGSTKISMPNVVIAGRRLQNAGYFGLGCIGMGALSGVFFYLAGQSAKDLNDPRYSNIGSTIDTYNTFGTVFAIVAGVCYIAIPIEVISSGGKMKKIK